MDPAAVGAFFSGVGAALGALVSLRISDKRARRDCEERLEQFKKAMDLGMHLKERDE